MRKNIFTDHEREILETFLIKPDVDNIALSKIFKNIKNYKILFEDIYLYLSIRKKMKV